MSVIKTHESKSFYTLPRERKTKNRARLAKKKKKKKAEIESRTSQTCARARVWFRRVHSGEVGFLYSRAIDRDHFMRPQSSSLIVEEGLVKKRSQKRNKKEKRGSPLFRVLKNWGEIWHLNSNKIEKGPERAFLNAPFVSSRLSR